MSKQKSNAISCPNCRKTFPSNKSISSHLQTCQTIRTGWNPLAPRDQIIAQEFQDIQADQTINEQLKIAATELKNPSIQQKSAYRTQTTSMPSLMELATIHPHSTEYVFPEDPNYSMDATEHPLEEGH